MSRACRDADAPRLSDHRGAGARAVPRRLGSRSAPDRRSRARPQASRRFRSAGQAAPRCGSTPAISRAISHVGAAIAAIGLPKCVASSGTPEKIRHGLTCAGLYDTFAPHIFSATQVERGKPAPDLFLFAAEQMRASAARCVVIEDSVPGVTARACRRNDRAGLSRRQPLPAPAMPQRCAPPARPGPLTICGNCRS